MKRGLSNATALALLAVGITIAACQKDPVVCTSYTELTGADEPVDLSILSPYPAFADTLAQYPQLQVMSVQEDNYAIGMDCSVRYKGILVLSSYYGVFITKANNQPHAKSTPYIDTTGIPASLTPSISATDAIDIARGVEPFEHSCIAYRLALYDLHAGNSNYTTPDYRLVWKVQTNEGNRYVLVDAHSGEMLLHSDGMIYE